jgi:hypothetical protein
MKLFVLVIKLEQRDFFPEKTFGAYRLISELDVCLPIMRKDNALKCQSEQI